MPREAPVTRAMREARGGDMTIYAFVMPGLVPGIHVFGWVLQTWMAGTSPAMTEVSNCKRA